MSMLSVQKIEEAIAGLTPEQRDELLLWVEQHYLQSVDERLAEDLSAGRLDDRLERALAADTAGKTRAL